MGNLDTITTSSSLHECDDKTENIIVHDAAECYSPVDTMVELGPRTEDEFKIGTTTRSLTSRCSTAQHQSLRSMTSRASFFLDTVGSQNQLDSERVEEEEAILNEMIHSGAPVPPDGGYGWVIVFVSFISNLILDGITCTFGIFLPAMVESFDAGKGQVAWAGSLLCGGCLCIGPIVGACTNKFGCRIVCVTGSIIATTGFILSAFANSLTLMILSYGILGAIGFGLIYLPNIVSVGYYFEKRRALATGIAVCGSGFGATTFAPMASWLTSQTTWRNVNLLYAGLLFICGVCGALIRPLEIRREALDNIGDEEAEEVIDPDPRRRPLLYRIAEERKQYAERSSITGSDYFMVQLPDGTMECRQKLPLNVDPGVHSSFHLDQFQLTGSYTPVNLLTPIHSILSTITEREQKQESALEASGAEPGFKEPIEEEEECIALEHDPSEVNLPSSRHSSFGREIESHHHFNFRKSFDGSKVKSSESIDPDDTHRPNHDDLSESSQCRRSYPLDAVPHESTLESKIFSRRGSVSSQNGSRRTSISISIGKSDYPAIHPSLKSTHGSTGSVHRIIRPMSRKDIFYSGSITRLPEYSQHTGSYRQSILNLQGASEEMRRKANFENGTKSSKICAKFQSCLVTSFISIQTFMDFSLLKNPVFLCIALSGVVGMLGFYIPFVYVVDFCAEKGIPSDDAAFLLSIIGAMNTVGRVGFGLLSDLRQVNSLYVNNFCLLGMGLAVTSVPWCSTLTSMMITYVLFGLCLSGFIALTSITLVDLLGLDNLTNAFGLLIFFRGFASIIGSPFAGFLYDTFKSYDVPFILAGSFLITASLISSAIPIVVKFQNSLPKCPSLSHPLDPLDLGIHPVLEDILEAREPEEEVQLDVTRRDVTSGSWTALPQETVDRELKR